MTIGEKIATLCRERHWELKYLAEKVGIPYTTLLSYVNRRQRMPPLDSAFLIAKALGVSLDWLGDPAAELPASQLPSQRDIREYDPAVLVDEIIRRKRAFRNALLDLYDRSAAVRDFVRDALKQPDSMDAISFSGEFSEKFDFFLESTSLYGPQIEAWAGLEGRLEATELTHPTGLDANKLNEITKVCELLSEAHTDPNARARALRDLVDFWKGIPWASIIKNRLSDDGSNPAETKERPAQAVPLKDLSASQLGEVMEAARKEIKDAARQEIRPKEGKRPSTGKQRRRTVHK